MFIEPHMRISDLIERMGDATERQAEEMRALLTAYKECNAVASTEDIPDSDWLCMLDLAVSNAED